LPFFPGCPEPVTDDAAEDEDHPDDDDEMGRVLSDGKARDEVLVGVRHDTVLDDIEQEAERHSEQAEAGEQWERTRRRLRDGEQVSQGRLQSLLLTTTILTPDEGTRQVFRQRSHAIEGKRRRQPGPRGERRLLASRFGWVSGS
jgi:hypothetical protein